MLAVQCPIYSAGNGLMPSMITTVFDDCGVVLCITSNPVAIHLDLKFLFYMDSSNNTIGLVHLKICQKMKQKQAVRICTKQV